MKLKTAPNNADGSSLSDEEYRRRRTELLKIKLNCEKLLNEVGQRGEQILKLSEQTFEFACAVQERFTNGDAKAKKLILTTMGSNLILKDKRLLIEARKPFFMLGNLLSAEIPITQPIEPEKTYVRQEQFVPSIFVRPLLRGQRDDVRTLQHENEEVVKAIYHFFRSAVADPSFNLSDWFLLYHAGSMDDRINQREAVKIA